MGFKPLVDVSGVVAGMHKNIGSVGDVLDVVGGTPLRDAPCHGIGAGRDARHIGPVVPPGQLQGKAGEPKLGHCQDAFSALVGLA